MKPGASDDYSESFVLRYEGVRSAASLARRRGYELESKICIDIHQQESEDGSLKL